jgi:hypothetical protein
MTAAVQQIGTTRVLPRRSDLLILSLTMGTTRREADIKLQVAILEH